jgi:membrane peptidoglycan carboxypeptidase
VTALQISRFLQAVGNQGMMVSPNTKVRPAIRRVMQDGTALRLQSAMRDVVQRGTATSIATALAGMGWQMGGKTGSGPDPASSISVSAKMARFLIAENGAIDPKR